MARVAMSLLGPTLPTWTVQQDGSYPGYTGRGANAVERAARDPNLPPTVHPSSPTTSLS